MSEDPRVHLEATCQELQAAESHLQAMLTAPDDDEAATERICLAAARLRAAQARHTAARSGLGHLPDLVGHG